MSNVTELYVFLFTVYLLHADILTVQKTTNTTCMVHSVLWLRLFLPQDLFIDMESDRQAPCCMTLCSKIVVMYLFCMSGLNL